jgi:hypothetical protein
VIACPRCEAKAVDITTNDDLYAGDERRKYLCTGPDQHEFREGDGPDPESEPMIVLATH